MITTLPEQDYTFKNTPTLKPLKIRFLTFLLAPVLSALVLFSSKASAIPTDIVPAFNNGAAVLYPTAKFRASVLQKDGKLVVSGDYNSQFITVRYNSNGNLDSSFNGTGAVMTQFGGRFAGASSMAIQKDGKIVVAGANIYVDRFTIFHFNLAMVRYNTDGSLDNTFDGDGKLGGGTSDTEMVAINAVAIQSDQKIVIADRSGAVLRFNPNGSPDPSFTQPFSGLFGDFSNISSIAVQPDDKIFVVRSDSNFVVTRLNPNGTLDNSFNGNGTAVTDFGALDKAVAIAIQPDGKAVVAGYSLLPGMGQPERFALARYNTNGTLDQGFDGDGKVTTDFGLRTTTTTYFVSLQNDGKIIETGAGLIVRYNANGSIDQGFYDAGRLPTEPGVMVASTLVAGNTLYLVGDYNSANGYLYVTALDNGQKSGLNYRYYEGNWTSLPNFTTVPVIKSGLTPNVNTAVIPQSTAQQFGLVWEGYLNIQTPGTYTFETRSDDGSMLFFNGFYNFDSNPLINNDGLHPPTSVSNSVNVTAPGKYPIAVTYFENQGLNHVMEFYWSGPGFTRQPVPTSVLSPRTLDFDSIAPSTPANLRILATGNDFVSLAWDSVTDNSNFIAFELLQNGILKSYTPIEAHYTVTGLNPNTAYTFAVRARDQSGNRSALSNQVTATTGVTAKQGLNYRFFNNISFGSGLDGLTPFKTGTTNNVDISQRPQGINNNYAYIWEGYIYIPTAGTYTFETVSDDGSKLFFNSLYTESNIPIINNFNNNGEHAVLSATGTVDIPAAGYYPIGISYRQYGGDQSMQLFWQGPGITRQLIPDAAFTYETPQSVQSAGLKFSYYEGAWTELPDFNKLNPVKTGMTFKPDLSIMQPEHTDNFAILWEGYIDIPAAGSYSFAMNSDDGSKFYFNSKYDPSAKALIDIDGVHAPQGIYVSGVYVPAAGRYPIAISYFERDGGELFNLSWAGPGFAIQPVPSSAFTQEPPPPAARGLNFKYYEGAWFALPDFTTLTPVNTYKSANVDISLRTRARNDYFAFLWEGTITIPTPGLYTFETVSDDGSRLYFNSLYNAGATPTVNNDGIHAPTSATGTVNITSAGVYPIAITYFEREGGEQMQVYWTGPGITRQRIPDEAFAGFNPALQNITAPVGNQALNAESILKQVSVYPNPFDRKITVGFYNSLATNDINIGIYDINGKLVNNYHAGKLPAGDNTVAINVENLPMTNGVYMVRLQVNGISVKTYKLVRIKR